MEYDSPCKIIWWFPLLIRFVAKSYNFIIQLSNFNFYILQMYFWGGLAPSMENVGSLSRTAWLAKPFGKFIWYFCWHHVNLLIPNNTFYWVSANSFIWGIAFCHSFLFQTRGEQKDSTLWSADNSRISWLKSYQFFSLLLIKAVLLLLAKFPVMNCKYCWLSFNFFCT